MDAAFGDDDAAVIDLVQQLQRGVEAGFEGAQVAVVDALQRGVEVQGDVEFGAAV